MKKLQTTNENPNYQKHVNAINTVYRFAGLPTKNTFPGLDEAHAKDIKEAFLNNSGQKYHRRALNTVARYAGLSIDGVSESIKHHQQTQFYSKMDTYTEAA